MRSIAISSHAPKPRDRPRLSRCPRLLRIDSRFALRTSHVVYHAVQPRESSRWRKCSRAFDMWSSRGATAARHASKPRATFRLTILLRPLRSLRRNSDRSAAISDHAPQPSESLRFTILLTPLRSFCKNALRPTAISDQGIQPRDSPRFIMWRNAFDI